MATPVFLPGKSHGQSKLEDYRSWDHKRVRHNLVIKQRHMCVCDHVLAHVCTGIINGICLKGELRPPAQGLSSVCLAIDSWCLVLSPYPAMKELDMPFSRWSCAAPDTLELSSWSYGLRPMASWG